MWTRDRARAYRPAVMTWPTTHETSARMARVPASGARSTEGRLRAALRARGIRWTRANDARLPGSPDLTFSAARLVVFVDGCFWHACPLHYRTPRTNARRWRSKIAANRRRDVRVVMLLASRGWTVLRVWEHELPEDGLYRVVEIVADHLHSRRRREASKKVVHRSEVMG